MFRLNFLGTNRDGTSDMSATMPFPITPALKAEFPEDGRRFALVRPKCHRIGWKDKTFGKDVRQVDGDFLTMFTFPMSRGNAKTALTGLSDIVISEKMAKDVFRSGRFDGQTAATTHRTISGKPFTVTGVLGNAPRQLDVRFDALIRSRNAGDYLANKDRWDHGSHECICEAEGRCHTRQRYNIGLQAFMNKYFAGDIEEQVKQGYPKNELGFQKSLLLQPSATYISTPRRPRKWHKPNVRLHV